MRAIPRIIGLALAVALAAGPALAGNEKPAGNEKDDLFYHDGE